MSATIASIADLISKPAFWVLAGLGILYMAFAAYVDTLDAPDSNSSNAYRHYFLWCNHFCMRANRAAIAFHVPINGDDDKSDAASAGK